MAKATGLCACAIDIGATIQAAAAQNVMRNGLKRLEVIVVFPDTGQSTRPIFRNAPD
ncbi:hypothetical protein GCM10011273_19350 [Asticcacaulis endophyticus]|uniref:Uncharacterized protein n=1 Tax=Asticcacaulis endophyticus TaxID=1395890 RepID=A0A918UU57_9CAUL|nr:hypothetical protein GCM10011273_19350 [Asticcacaulis endophyticus]